MQTPCFLSSGAVTEGSGVRGTRDPCVSPSLPTALTHSQKCPFTIRDPHSLPPETCSQKKKLLLFRHCFEHLIKFLLFVTENPQASREGVLSRLKTTQSQPGAQRKGCWKWDQTV